MFVGKVWLIRTRAGIYWVNIGLFLGQLYIIFDEKLTNWYYFIPACGALQALSLLLGANHENEGVGQTAGEPVTIVVVPQIRNIFKHSKTTPFLLLVYLSYCVLSMFVEVHPTSLVPGEKRYYLAVIPLIYMGINMIMEFIQRRVMKLNTFSAIMLFMQVTISIFDLFMINSYSIIYSCIISVINIIFFQKVFFLNITITLLRVFEIKNIETNKFSNVLINRIQLFCNVISILFTLIIKDSNPVSIFNLLTILIIPLNVISLILFIYFMCQENKKNNEMYYIDHSLDQSILYADLHNSVLINEGKYILYYLWGSTVTIV